MKGYSFSAIILLTSSFNLVGQNIINAYARVTNVSGTTLTLSNTNVTYGDLLVGNDVLVMQMQDDVIGGNTGNNQSFGNIATVANAGVYEKATIASVNAGGNQTHTIWEEDFEDLSDNTTVDTGESAWSRTCNCGGSGGSVRTFEVNNVSGNNLFEGKTMTGVGGTWTSETFSISGFSNVTIDIDLAQVGFDNNAADNISVQYSLDGALYVEFAYVERIFTAQTVSVSSLSGSTLSLMVVVKCNSNNDYGRFDNVRVTGQKYVPTSITLENTLSNTYSTGANSSLQIISYPTFASFSTTKNLTALDWDGNIGGVFAMNVTGTLTLNHNINLDGKGFRGGSLNTTNETNGNCDALTYRTNNGQYGRKGEGIYKNTNASYVAGRARMANGGGGGNKHNSGAGGGGNFTAGGMGGPGYNESNNSAGCPDDPSGDAGTGAGAYGGADLSNYISASRIFMGGAGGGGQQDNATTGASEAGGDGGGIVIIKANEISVPCGAGVSITANGVGFPYPATDAGWEGAPGAGAGGTLLFQVNTWDLTCSLATEAKGGEGQSSVYTLPHGGGGGGGKGVSIFSGAIPSSNYTSDNSEGVGGLNGTNPASGSAAQGSASPANPEYASNGIIESEQGPLPVVLLFWKGTEENGVNHLTWATATEDNNEFFTIERSTNGTDWKILARVPGNGNSTDRINYAFDDRISFEGVTYYRLSQTDYDGTTEVFKVISLNSQLEASNILLYPNPSDGKFTVQLSPDQSEVDYTVEVIDVNGKIRSVRFEREYDQLKFDMSDQPTGNYLLRISNGITNQIIRVQIR